jgi:2-dehydro-3-deoxyphosphogluconate aldolase/(4S)-4-hydroxy-2-oxoglutarate aldolase
MNETVINLGEVGIIPVVAIERAEDAKALGQALLAGGLPCAEITFRTAAAEEAIRSMATAFPEMLVGAGTVLSADQARRAVAAGATYIVSPGFDPAVVDWCLANDVAIMPGVATPTDVTMAVNQGLEVVKFFPAEALGGTRTLKAIGAPFGGVKFIPTGGINAGNLGDYLKLPMVHACGGSWMVKKQLISAGDFAAITAQAQEAVNLVTAARAA